jgi:hypothetical protein
MGVRWPVRPKAFTGAVEAAVSADRSLPEVDGGGGGLAVFIDTYERLDSLDDWLREQYLPSLPAQTLIMIAGRQPPSVEWRTAPGWAAVLHVLPLRNFRPEESRAYLTSRGIPERQLDDILGFTHATRSHCHCSPTFTGCSQNALQFTIPT